MEEISLSQVNTAESGNSFEMIDYVQELFLHAVEQQKTEKKRLRTARVTLVLVACMAAVLIISALVILPAVTGVLAEAQSVLEKVNAVDLQTLMTDINGFIAQANSSLKSVGDAASQLENLNIAKLNEAISSLAVTVESFSKIDIATLNEAIKNLNDTAEPFAKFFGKF